MILRIIVLLIAFPVVMFGQKAHSKVSSVPLTYKYGSGPFSASLSAVGFEESDTANPWNKTYLKVQGIPANWSKVQKGMIWLNAYQFVYQNHLNGNIDSSFYCELKQGWQWIPDSEKLFPKTIKCYIYIARGEDENGKEWTVIDANNNLDFSDEIPFIAVEHIQAKSFDSIQVKPFNISYEKLEKGKVITTTVPIQIVKMHNYLFYGFPQYGLAKFDFAGQAQEILVSSGSADFTSSKIMLMNDSLLSKKAIANLLVSEGEYVFIKEIAYKNLGVNFAKNTLELEKIEGDYDRLFSTQINFKAIPFAGKEFTTMKAISLNKYQGKFLFLDFWASWCGPCVKEIPNIREAYEKLDKNKIEILGIVGEDDPTALKKIIEKEKMIWPQILSDETNKIVEAYHINGYPTSFLINPEGIIVAKNLRGVDLYDAIMKFMIK